jgi:hypothetical protein
MYDMNIGDSLKENRKLITSNNQGVQGCSEINILRGSVRKLLVSQ